MKLQKPRKSFEDTIRTILITLHSLHFLRKYPEISGRALWDHLTKVFRCVLVGVSSGANIANYVAQKAVEAGRLFDPVRVVAQVLMYPFFIGSVTTHSEIKLANSYLYDKSSSALAWRLFLPEDDFSLDHPAANPFTAIPGRGMPLKYVPPTLTVVSITLIFINFWFLLYFIPN